MPSEKRKKKTHYLDNKKFEETIKNYLENPEKYESELVEKLDLLITNIINTFKFKIDPDDAKQECFVLAFKILKNFEPKKGSAFNYFTTVCVNQLKLLYTKNKKYMEKIMKYQEIKRPHDMPPQS
jgi:DNA-directed RNA polymerase specialized sigma subunit|tara:strand:+ start:702 stop:1076 length:375 start_codon:yes stop_codon:yes gene_type:complete